VVESIKDTGNQQGMQVAGLVLEVHIILNTNWKLFKIGKNGKYVYDF